MFGTNEITGQKDFADAPMNSLLVNAIFYTLQGEGPLACRPAVFLRLSGCNLDCNFCDTAFESGKWMTFDEIRAEIIFLLENSHHTENLVLVVTGGEPALQANLTGFLLREITNWDEVQIETNGTIERSYPLGTTVVVSPKVREKDGLMGRYIKPSEAVLQRADALKFVVDADDSSPYYSIPTWAEAWAGGPHQRKHIFISPMNHYLPEAKVLLMFNDAQRKPRTPPSFWDDRTLDRVRNQANHEHAAALCLLLGYRLSLQAHLYASIP